MEKNGKPIMVRTQFYLGRGQSLKGHTFQAGDVIADIIHPACLPAHHVLEFCRGSVQSMETRQVPLIDERQAAGGENPCDSKVPGGSAGAEPKGESPKAKQKA